MISRTSKTCVNSFLLSTILRNETFADETFHCTVWNIKMQRILVYSYLLSDVGLSHFYRTIRSLGFLAGLFIIRDHGLKEEGTSIMASRDRGIVFYRHTRTHLNLWKVVEACKISERSSIVVENEFRDATNDVDDGYARKPGGTSTRVATSRHDFIVLLVCTRMSLIVLLKTRWTRSSFTVM